MSTFADYSAYYNLLYKDKKYAAEADFVVTRLRQGERQVHTLLDLGCGTGRHAMEMARRGIAPTGVDMSETMLDMGRQELAQANIHPCPQLLWGDARSVRLGQTFDAASSLFHVMSYQTSEEDALAVLKTAHCHLKPGGCFLFDFWYGVGVLTDPPTQRHRLMEDSRARVERTATPVHRLGDNIVEVHYDIQVTLLPDGQQRQLQETHAMRYWFFPELRFLAAQAGFSVEAEGSWMHTSMRDAKAWNAWMMVRV